MTNAKKLVITAMLVALCVVLPIAFHSIPRAGAVLMPMHIPVLLAGLVCGWKFGIVAGVAGPLLSSLITGMPPTGIVPIMMLELGTYGLVAGLVVQFVRTKRTSLDLYIALVSAMLIGRVVAGIAQFAYFFGGELFGGSYVDGVYHSSYTVGLWAGTYFVTSLPGLVIQILFIPSVVIALERERLIPSRYPSKAAA